MEERITPIEEPIIKAVQVGTQIVDKVEYIACDGKVFNDKTNCVLYEAKLRREKLVEDIPFKRVETDNIDVPYNYYYVDTTDKLVRLINYIQLDEKIYWLNYHKLTDTNGELIHPMWIGVQYNDGGDGRDYYTITTFEEIKRDYEKLTNAFNSLIKELSPKGEEDGVE